MGRLILFVLAVIIIAGLIISANNTNNASDSFSYSGNGSSSLTVNEQSTGCKLAGYDTCNKWNNEVKKAENLFNK
jgi:hypothetical protein